MDYQIWKKRNGSEIVLCNLEELLLDYLGVTTLTEASSYLKSNRTEYAIKCPFCSEEGYEKEKLYIHSDLQKGYCFKCTRTFVNVNSDIRYDIKIPSMITNSNEQFSLVKLSDPNWSLDLFYDEFDDYDEIGYNYLVNKRHKYMDPLYKVLGIKFHDHNPVIPFYYNGDLIYYQVRFIRPGRIKYFMPPISHKPPYIIEHGDNKSIIICEGVFDAISLLIQAPSSTPFAVLGSSISDYQLEFLRSYCPSNIRIYMDETDISMKILRKVRSVIDYCPISIIKSNGEDPEEKLKYLINSKNRNIQWLERINYNI